MFDKRVALNPKLDESNLQQCFVCLAILTVQEQSSPQYVPAKSCPHCFQSEAEKYQKLIPLHQQAICKITSPLPGQRCV